MKKPYSEPDILFESFALSTSIAAGCEAKPDTQTSTCGVQFGRSIVFVDGMTDNCNSLVADEGKNEYNNLCYHVPYENYNVFLS